MINTIAAEALISANDCDREVNIARYSLADWTELRTYWTAQLKRAERLLKACKRLTTAARHQATIDKARKVLSDADTMTALARDDIEHYSAEAARLRALAATQEDTTVTDPTTPDDTPASLTDWETDLLVWADGASAAEQTPCYTTADENAAQDDGADAPEYIIEVAKRVVSYRAENCAYAAEDDHECDGECTWMNGDSRELKTPNTEEITADADNLEEFDGDAVAWAVDYIFTKTDAVEPSASPVGDTAHEREWLSGSYEDPYQGDSRVTETTVRLTDGWSGEQRARVFAGVLSKVRGH
ncbi:hypothetical protein [Streptomyces sp. NPDC088727]|uniref:hypothetical protein n=1 Tax=Streptomyces sp. NPDC088727 TaxID=3365875 RepID=UPI00382B9920